MSEKTNEKLLAFVRLVVPLYAFLNATLIAMGYDPLPFESDKVDAFVTGVIGFVGIVAAWWKNNNVTRAAREAQRVLDAKKGN